MDYIYHFDGLLIKKWMFSDPQSIDGTSSSVYKAEHPRAIIEAQTWFIFQRWDYMPYILIQKEVPYVSLNLFPIKGESELSYVYIVGSLNYKVGAITFDPNVLHELSHWGYAWFVMTWHQKTGILQKTMVCWPTAWRGAHQKMGCKIIKKKKAEAARISNKLQMTNFFLCIPFESLKPYTAWCVKRQIGLCCSLISDNRKGTNDWF